MKELIIFSVVSTGALIGLFVYGWYFYEPQVLPPCEEGWQIVRRFGFDIYLGDIPVEDARQQAGGNVLEWTKNITDACDPWVELRLEI